MNFRKGGGVTPIQKISVQILLPPKKSATLRGRLEVFRKFIHFCEYKRPNSYVNLLSDQCQMLGRRSGLLSETGELRIDISFTNFYHL